MAVSEASEVAVMEIWLIDSPDPKPMHHGLPQGHYNQLAPVGVHSLNDFWNECYRTKGIANQTLQQDVQCIYVQSICIRDW